MLAQYLQFVSADRDENGNITIDVSNYDYVLAQPIGGAIQTIQSTINSGAVQGVSDGSAISATNFTPAAAIRVSTGNTFVTSIAAGEIGKLNVVGRYVRFNCANNMSDLFVMLTKIS